MQEFSSSENITQFLSELVTHFYEEREKQVGSEVARQMEVFVYLNTIDTLWIEHLDTMDDLRSGIGLRGYAQRDPLIEYKREGFELFEKLMVEVDYEIAHRIYKVALQGQGPVVVHPQTEVRPEIDIPSDIPKAETINYGDTKVTIERGGVVTQQSIRDDGAIQHPKIGRNDPCHCGSGKKYKKCHYPN